MAIGRAPPDGVAALAVSGQAGSRVVDCSRGKRSNWIWCHTACTITSIASDTLRRGIDVAVNSLQQQNSVMASCSLAWSGRETFKRSRICQASWSTRMVISVVVSGSCSPRSLACSRSAKTLVQIDSTPATSVRRASSHVCREAASRSRREARAVSKGATKSAAIAATAVNICAVAGQSTVAARCHSRSMLLFHPR